VNSKNLYRLTVLLLTSFMLVACETAPPQSTNVSRVLIAPNIASAPYGNVLVIGIVPSRETARNIEFAIGEQLSKANVEAHSFVRESSSTEPTEEAIRELVAATGVDAIVVVAGQIGSAALTETSEQVNFDDETDGGNMFNYISYRRVEITRPKYATYTLDVTLITNVYDATTQARVYSVESGTVHGQTDYSIITAEAEAIVSRMKQDDLIK